MATAGSGGALGRLSAVTPSASPSKATIVADVRREQKFDPGAFSYWHRGHFMPGLQTLRPVKVERCGEPSAEEGCGQQRRRILSKWTNCRVEDWRGYQRPVPMRVDPAV